MKDIVHLYTHVLKLFSIFVKIVSCSSGFEPWDPETPLPGTPPGEVHRVPPGTPPPPRTPEVVFPVVLAS